MTQDEFSRGTFYYDSFGARRVLGWLVTGRIFDNHRFPVVSVLALIGLAVCVWRFRRTETARADPCRRVAQPACCSSAARRSGSSSTCCRARPTCSCVATSPACIWPASTWRGSAAHGRGRRRCTWFARAPGGSSRRSPPAALGVVLIAVVAPAAAERYSYERTGAGWISEQRAAQSTDGADFASLVAKAKATAPGRIYGGMRANKAAPKILFVPGVRRAAEPRRRCRGVHAAHVVADVERGEPVRRTRRRAGGHVRRALGRPARRT